MARQGDVMRCRGYTPGAGGFIYTEAAEVGRPKVRLKCTHFLRLWNPKAKIVALEDYDAKIRILPRQIIK